MLHGRWHLHLQRGCSLFAHAATNDNDKTIAVERTIGQSVANKYKIQKIIAIKATKCCQKAYKLWALEVVAFWACPSPQQKQFNKSKQMLGKCCTLCNCATATHNCSVASNCNRSHNNIKTTKKLQQKQ